MEPATPAPEMPVAPSLPRDLAFDTQPYVPDGGFSAVGLLVLLIGLGAAGIGMGVLAYYVSLLFYLILLFPVAIGIVVGFVGMVLVKTGKIRAPWLAGIAGLLAGVLAVLTTHYMDYRSAMKEIEVQRNAGAAINLHFGPQEQRDIRRKMMEMKSFADYLDLQATIGVTLKRGAGKDKGINLGYVGSYIYWLVEMGIVAGIVFAMTRSPAREPFCTSSNEWKTERCGDNFAVPQELGVDAVVSAVRDGAVGKLAELKQVARESTTPTIPVRIYVYASPQHSDVTPVDVKLNQFVTNKNGQQEEKEILLITYPAQALPSLETLCRM